MKNDTIAAIATSLSNSGIGIVRISGENAIDIIDKIFKKVKGNKKISSCKSHTIHYGFIKDGEETIDEVLVLLMKGPNSYTREDTVEINCHGGVIVTKKILETVVKYGARPADPGEYTKRAFLNGRIDLSQAEAVIDIINAKNDLALKSSVSHLKGAVYNKIKKIREKIIYNIAFIESALDDPENISTLGYGESLLLEVENLLMEIENLLLSADNGKIIKEGIKTVIVGKPNAGKSSLLNLLVGSDRAIVTDIAGTTRDIIEETINLNGISLNIVDTAGIRNTDDTVEKIGVSKAKEYAADADVIIYVVDSSAPLDESDEDIISLIKNKKSIVLLNKSDLNQIITEEILRKKLDTRIIPFSAKKGIGMEIFEKTLKEMFFHGEISFNDEVYITNMRQKNAIEEAYNSLKQVKNSILNEMPEDFYSIDLMSAYESLGEVIGELIDDDLVNEIFEKFCTGK